MTPEQSERCQSAEDALMELLDEYAVTVVIDTDDGQICLIPNEELDDRPRLR